jgi:hypothetical protein
MNYELLWECFMSDQMSAKQLDEHIKEDPAFEEFVWNKIREIRDALEETASE